MKLVISEPKTGKSYQVELSEDKKAFLLDKKIGEKVEGSLIGADGYEMEITGGSDDSGFPMRNDIYGSRKVRAHLGKGVGYRPESKGEKKKKMVRGNAVSSETSQVNMRVMKEGSKKLEELFGKPKEEKKE
ncbi:MAG: 30S ribosomal protein S6e [Candidatus ainarchaeum sp.]|nr:30S ribosomal protein S6e [Candidatus ainarchaeum sp.]